MLPSQRRLYRLLLPGLTRLDRLLLSGLPQERENRFDPATPSNLHNADQPPPFTSLAPRGLPSYTSGSREAQTAAMSEAYFRVESGALGPQENFLSLDDILMSHEKLPVRTEIPMPRLGTFFQERSGGADTDNAIPQVSLSARSSVERLQLPVGLAALGTLRHWARCPLGFVVLGEAGPYVPKSSVRSGSL